MSPNHCYSLVKFSSGKKFNIKTIYILLKFGILIEFLMQKICFEFFFIIKINNIINTKLFDKF